MSRERREWLRMKKELDGGVTGHLYSRSMTAQLVYPSIGYATLARLDSQSLIMFIWSSEFTVSCGRQWLIIQPLTL